VVSFPDRASARMHECVGDDDENPKSHSVIFPYQAEDALIFITIIRSVGHLLTRGLFVLCFLRSWKVK